MNQDISLLEVSHLQVSFAADSKVVPVVHDVSFQIKRGEIVALVGESGSGKSVTALSIMKLHAKSTRFGDSSSIRFQGQDILRLSNQAMKKIRGNEMAMIFQDPMSSLNPVQRIEKQITESILLHQRKSKAEAKRRAKELLNQVGIPDADKRLAEYPHRLSGGMRQRVMIAMALACNPALLIADEPTTALDVTIQAQVLDIMKRLQEQTGISILLITHDLGVVAEMADRVLVMYAGRIVEEGTVVSVFENPIHPYTQALLRSVPKLTGPKERLISIAGTVPSPFNLLLGCAFHSRCPFVTYQCKTQLPAYSGNHEHRSACWNPVRKEGTV